MKHLLLVLMIALAGNSWAGSEGTIGTPPPNKATIIGGTDGTNTQSLQLEPGSLRLKMALPTPGAFFGAGIAGDTTQALGTIVGQYYDTDSAPWTTANLYLHKALLINITTISGAGASVCFKVQGSYTGLSTDWQDILIPKINAGTALAAPETLQFVSDQNGAPFLTQTAFTGGPTFTHTISLDAVSTTAGGVIQNPCAPFAMLRIAVLNRTTTSSLTYTVRWIGSQ